MERREEGAKGERRRDKRKRLDKICVKERREEGEKEE
jgi:hypothetical protein